MTEEINSPREAFMEAEAINEDLQELEYLKALADDDGNAAEESTIEDCIEYDTDGNPL